MAAIVMASYGGETVYIGTVPECINTTIEVSGSINIDNGEYSILNCSEVMNDTWFCNCTDVFDIVVKTNASTINNYSFDFTYWHTEIENGQVTQSRGSSGGGSSCRPNFICGGWESCIDGIQIRTCEHEGRCYFKPYNETQNCTITEPKQEETDPEQVDEIIVEPEKDVDDTSGKEQTQKENKRYLPFILIGLFITVILGGVLLLYITRR